MDTEPQSSAETVDIGISSLQLNCKLAGVDVKTGPSVSTIVKY